jgi:hypothetical protein
MAEPAASPQRVKDLNHHMKVTLEVEFHIDEVD